jgi:hypothetical protein
VPTYVSLIRFTDRGSRSYPPPQLLEAIEHPSHFHREHEVLRARPSALALELQATSGALKASAARWTDVEPAPTAETSRRLAPGPLEHHRALLVAPLVVAHAPGEVLVGRLQALVDLLHGLLVVA